MTHGDQQRISILNGLFQVVDGIIVASQHAKRGGWRYTPAVGSDTSVSGWMVMALRSAELAGLEVPQSVWDGVEHWLQMAQASSSRSELYRYNPMAPDTPAQAAKRSGVSSAAPRRN